MNCIFCAAPSSSESLGSNNKVIRNLSVKEIVEQVENILRTLKPNNLVSKRVLFSFMGMGEPFLNYQNIVLSIRELANNFVNSRATISTLGVSPKKLREIAHEEFQIPLNIHLSLHAPNEDLRRKILPHAGKIKSSLDALEYFSVIRKVNAKINYLLIKDLNDSEAHALQLAELLKPYLFAVKLSKLNSYRNLRPSPMSKFILFEEILNTRGIETSRFASAGTDINAGCGQLRRRFALPGRVFL